MRFFFFLSLFFVISSCFASEKLDSTKSRFSLTGNLSINSNGMASIPAFSLGKPALMASFALQKKRFSYDPVVAYGLNFRPWIFDNWLHYRPINNERFELRIGADFSMFFSEYDDDGQTILQGQQYITFEIAGFYKFGRGNSIGLMYWNDNGQDHGTMDGDFYNIVYDMPAVEAGRYLVLSVNVQFFYIDYTGKNDGLFISPRISGLRKGIPLAPFFQVTQGIKSNVEPFPGFRWNVGIEYLF
jgi:hypothetical protein